MSSARVVALLLLGTACAGCSDRSAAMREEELRAATARATVAEERARAAEARAAEAVARGQELEKRIAMLEADVRALAHAEPAPGPGGPPPGAPPPVRKTDLYGEFPRRQSKPVPIKATVLAADATAGIYIISAGSQEGLKEGDKMTVFRRDTFVASVVVEKVFADKASVAIEKVNGKLMKKSDIQVGDKVAEIY